MTAHPNAENAGHWWLTTRSAWRRLHAVPADRITPEELQDALDDCEPLTRMTACGRTLRFTYPGLLSRFGMSRCAHCCRALGIPAGEGTPCNAAATTTPDDDHPESGDRPMTRVPVKVLLTVGNDAELTTPDHTPSNPLRVPARTIADDAGLPVNELPGREFTAVQDGQGLRDFRLVDDPRQ